jgi:hypothetical protein
VVVYSNQIIYSVNTRRVFQLLRESCFEKIIIVVLLLSSLAAYAHLICDFEQGLEG